MARAKQDMRKHVPPPLAHCAETRRRDALLRVLFPLPILRSNLIHQTCPHGCLQLSFRPHFDHSGFGNDAGPRRRRRDVASALASPALLGARRLDRESVSVFGGGLVDFLSLAQSAAMDVFPFYLCSDFAHHLVPGLYHSLS